MSWEDKATDLGINRRTLMKTVGAGVGLSAVSGLGQARTLRSEMGLPSAAQVSQQASGDEIHPVFGFSALSGDVEPPEEPDHEVQALIQPREQAPIPEFFFEPTGLFIEPGDTVQFTMTTPHHNVVAYHPGFGFIQRVPDGVPPFSGPLLPAGGYWLYRFEQEGVYEMNCAPHEYFGMVMRIVVGESAGPAAKPLPDLCAQPEGDEEEGGGPELRHPEFTAYTVLTDPALDPQQIVGAGSVPWEDLQSESKRLFLQAQGFPPCAETGQSESSEDGGETAAGGNGKAKKNG